MFVTLMMLLAAPQAAPDPLAQARAGKLQCIQPNKEKKTCLAIGSYTVKPDGSYESSVTVLINPAPAMTMETHSKGKVENGQVCGLILKEDYDAAKLMMGDAPMDETMAAGVRTQIGSVLGPMIGKKGCSAEKAEGEMMVSEVSLDGVAHPEMTQRFIWVGKDEGYTLGMP